MPLYGYTRVATGRQAAEGESLEVQTRRVHAYAMVEGTVVEHLWEEAGVSGSISLGERPCGRELLACVRKGDVVVAAKLDRMFRSAADALSTAEDFRNRGISLVLLDIGGDVTGNGMAKLFFTIVSAFAEAERDRISERQLDAKAAAKADGRYRGGKRPYGFNIVEGKLVKVPVEQEMIALARELRTQGEPLRTIRALLHGRHGCHLSLSALSRIVADRPAAVV